MDVPIILLNRVDIHPLHSPLTNNTLTQGEIKMHILIGIIVIWVASKIIANVWESLWELFDN